jgi:hypothetical protein
MEINKNSLHDFKQDFNTVVKTLNEKYGVTIQLGNISYQENKFNGKIEVVNKGATTTIAREEFERSAVYLGLKKSDFGKTFMSNGVLFKISGIKTRNRKYPILADNPQGDTYKFPIDKVKRLLGNG